MNVARLSLLVLLFAACSSSPKFTPGNTGTAGSTQGTSRSSSTSSSHSAATSSGATSSGATSSSGSPASSGSSGSSGSGNVPVAPQNLVAQSGNQEVTLSWSAVSGATSYTLYLGLAATVSPTMGSAVPMAVSPATLSGLTAGTTYYFVVTASDGAGEGPPSPIVQATPTYQDLTPPQVLFTNPINGQVAIDPAAAVVIGFSQPMNLSTLDGGLTLQSAAGPVDIAYSYTDAGWISLTPSTPLAFSSTYTATLGPTIADQAGVPLSATYTFGFTTRPVAPTNLAAIPGNAAVTLTFTGVSGATQYGIYRGTVTGGPYTLLGGSPGTTFTDGSPTDGTAYFYVVTAMTPAGESRASNEVSATPLNVNQAVVPANVNAIPGDQEATVAWTSSGAGDTYTLYRGRQRSGPYSAIASAYGSVTYHDTALTNGTTYYYVVQAVQGSAVSPLSSEAAATPSSSLLPSPAGLTVVATGSTWVQLGWTAVAGAAAYEVAMTSDLQQGYTLGGAPDTASLVVSGLTNGVTYYFSVAAAPSDGELGAYSGEVSALPTLLLPPQTTTLVEAYANSPQSIYLAWTAAAGATGYNLLRGTASGGPYSLVSPVTQTTFTDMTVTAGVTYYYVVLPTSNSQLTSAASNSNELSVQALGVDLTPPSGLAAEAGNGCFSVTWDPVPGATSYNIAVGTADGGPYAGFGGNTFSGGGSTYDNEATVCGAENTVPYYAVVTTIDSSGGTSSNSAQVGITPSASLPSSPGAPALHAGDGVVDVAWSAVVGATNYHVYRRADFSRWAEIGATPDLSYADATASNGTTYYYEVQSENLSGRGEISAAASAAPQSFAPDPPAGVVAQPGNGCFTVTWAPVEYATDYTVSVGLADGGPYGGFPGNTFSGATSAFDDEVTVCGAESGVTYHVVVTTFVTNVGSSANSAEVEVTPDSMLPANPGAPSLHAGDGVVDVSWSSVSGATRYHVYRRTAFSAWSEIGATAELSYVDATASNGTVYFYEVQTENSVGRGELSVSSSATPLPLIPDAPQGLAVQGGNDCFSLTWEPVLGATSYAVEVGTVSGGPYLGFPGNTFSGGGSTFDNEVTVCGGQESTPYFAVVATSSASAGTSASSSEVSVTPTSAVPGNAGAPTAVAGDGVVGVSWSTVANATTYHLYRRTDAVPWAELAATAELSFQDWAVSNGSSYFYEVQSEGAGGRGAISPSTSAVTPTSALPPSPSTVTAVAGNGCLSLTWAPVAGATSYQAAVGTSPGGPYSGFSGNTFTGGGSALDTEITVCGATNGVPYYAVVSTVVANVGDSVISREVTATPSAALPTAPAPQAAAGTSAGTIQLTWTASTGALGYRVMRSSATSGWAQVVETIGSTFADVGLTSGSSYSYELQAYGTAGSSAFSAEASATAP